MAAISPPTRTGHEEAGQSVIFKTKTGLIERLANKQTANRLLGWLLAASLLASTLNTLLLSLLVRFVGLDDRGFFGGQLYWDQLEASSSLQASTRLANGKSISLKSIESLGGVGESLKFQILPSSLNTTDNVTGRPAGVFLAAKSNYLADYNLASSGDDKSYPLEIGTNLLALNLAIEGPAERKRVESEKKTNINRKRKSWLRLLEFEQLRESLSLPQETQLRLEPATSGSVRLTGSVSSPQMIGVVGKNFDVQAREGHLKCAGESLKVVSKSAGVQLTSAGELNLSPADSLFVEARELYIPRGIRYFQEEEEEQQVARQPHQQASDGIRAYNLMLLEGGLFLAS